MIAYLGIGSNIDAPANIEKAIDTLSLVFPGARFSRVFQSEAVGFEGDDFLNLVAEIETFYSLPSLIENIKKIEDDLGRVRGGEKFSSRHIDIDILLYGDLICDEPIVLPREEILENAYVLWPLAELAPDLSLPGSEQTYLQRWQAFEQADLKIQPIE